jgi:lysophospholipase L1-like esterase
VTWGAATYPMYTNSLGWRDARPGRRLARSSGDRTRILVLGDSFAEGVGVAYELSIPAVVARRLDPGGRRLEVVNGGRASYCPLLEYQRLRRFLAAGYQVDVLVLLPDLSDVFDETRYGLQYEFGPGGEPLRFRESTFGPLVRALYNDLALARAARLAQWQITQRLFPPPPNRAGAAIPGAAIPTSATMSSQQLAEVPPGLEMMFKANWMFHPPSLRGWAPGGLRSLLDNVARIHRLAQARSIPLVVAIYPWPNLLYQREEPRRYDALAERFGQIWKDRELVLGRRPTPPPFEYELRLRALCRSRSIPLVDLFPEIQADERWEELYVPGDIHFNEKGYRLAAERISAVLRPLLAKRTGAP